MSTQASYYIERQLRMTREPKELMEAFQLLQRAQADLMDDRQRRYGSGNIRKFGAVGVLIRCSDKVERLRTLLMEGAPDDVEESIEDTFADLATYALIGLLVQRGYWDLPFQGLRP